MEIRKRKKNNLTFKLSLSKLTDVKLYLWEFSFLKIIKFNHGTRY